MQGASAGEVRVEGPGGHRVRSYVFGLQGELEIDLLSYELRRHGELVSLEPKTFDLLVYLIEHRNRVVPSKELFAKFWPPHISSTVLSHYVVVARKVIGDDVDKQELILTVRSRGYRFVGRVLERTTHDSIVAPRVPREATAEAAPRPSDAEPSPSGSFIGRAEQLEQLERALAQTLAGHGRLVLLSGEAGMGKTRLLGELTLMAERRGMRVISSRYGERDAPATWPFAQLAEPVQQGGGGDELARFRLIDAIAGVLRAASSERPVVLVLDDVHRADATSLAVLRHLARQVEGERTLIVAAFRSDSDIAGICSASGRWERIELSGWTAHEVAEVLRDAGGGSGDPHVAQRVHELTGGQPQLVREMARVLATRLSV